MAAILEGVFDTELQQKILNAKIFVVGAGGIGCELLKNLVLVGFQNIEIIDLDTIDVSNLNRQFLFHKQHVGKSKAQIATESALKFSPLANIKYYHDSVIGNDYNISFFEKFDVVLNALDNLTARYHVNRMCLAANVPLIESGTAGYVGQVELIKGGLTSCYECTPKRRPKDFPGCTIRNTPSEPIHCIVWAKHLFNQLFGEPDEDVSPDSEDPELTEKNVSEANDGEQLKNVPAESNADSSEKKTEERKGTRQWAQEVNFDPILLFNKFFKDDINYLLSMATLWSKQRKAPIPLDINNVPDSVASSSKYENGAAGLKEMKQWSIADCVDVFKESVLALKEQCEKAGADSHLVWDKDDRHAMDFVAAAANIRAYIFHIPQKTRFDIKSMAGNIIPAIATTNAIIAGVVVLRAFNVLLERLTDCQSVYLRRFPDTRNQLLVAEKVLLPPSPNCYICSKPEVVLHCNLNQLKIKDLDDTVLKKNLHMTAPDVLVKSVAGVRFIISSEEGETEENNEKTLKEMGIEDGSQLQVDDYLQNYKLEIMIRHYEAPKDKPEFIIDSGSTALGPKALNENGETSKAVDQAEEDDDDLIIEDDDVMECEDVTPKRKHDDDEVAPIPLKKRAIETVEDGISATPIPLKKRAFDVE